MKRLLFAALVLAAGCAPLQGLIHGRTPEEKAEASRRRQEHEAEEAADKADLEEAFTYPFKLKVTKEEAPDAWARAQVFISKWSDMKIQIANDAVIETFTPIYSEYEFRSKFGYTVTKTPLPDGVEIEINCGIGEHYANKATKDQIISNLHIAAMFIKTGKLAGGEHADRLIER